MKTGPKTPTLEDLRLLKDAFGYEEFRPHQFEAISALKKGSDVFLRKPTGGGKSLIYQYLALDKKALVLSPLIALMDDQVAQSKKYGIKSACMHSQQDTKERNRALKLWEKAEVNLFL